MENQLSADDIESLRWLDGQDAEQYWDRDENGEKVILRSDWGKRKSNITELLA